VANIMQHPLKKRHHNELWEALWAVLASKGYGKLFIYTNAHTLSYSSLTSSKSLISPIFGVSLWKHERKQKRARIPEML
jgi:hypothetical protein